MRTLAAATSLVALVVLSVLLAGCTGGGRDRTDSDDDGLLDSFETNGWDITIKGENGTLTRRVASDPNALDADEDGMLDVDEHNQRTDPNDADTDRDGLLDGFDVTPSAATADAWRARGIVETAPGTFAGERDICVDGLKPNEWSSDRPLPDKLGDGDEMRAWNVTVRGETIEVRTDPCVPDSDGDVLADDVEKRLATNPMLPDTDGDGTNDAIDAEPLWNLTLHVTRIVAQAPGTDGVRVTLAGGGVRETRAVTDTTTMELDVRDEGAKGQLEVSFFLAASDLSDAPLRLFGNETGTIVVVDLFAGTSTADAAPGVMETRGADGSLRLEWRVERR